ncbi:hypothetical protein MRM63_13770 [bacterium 19MO03SA05]|uniref:Uncharacterized protein n=1 Tax=bacterium 19MO03SA05 TaxID=2920620 RepID=A0AAU6VIJ3_UNCXX
MNWLQTKLTWPTAAAGIQTAAESVTNQVGSTMSAATGRLTALQSDANFTRHPLSSEAEALLNLRSELNSLLVQGTVISATPYQFQVGERLESGCYLSPANAVKALAAKLRDLSDHHRPKAQINVIAIMLTAQSVTEFATKLNTLCSVLSLPDWCQCARQTTALVTNEKDKLQQPTAIVQPRFKPAAHLTANPLTDYFAAQGAQVATLESLASDKTNVIAKMANLASKRSQKLNEISQSINALKALNGSVYSMVISGTPESIATQLKQAALPNNEPLTIASLMISNEPLIFWEGLLCSH